MGKWAKEMRKRLTQEKQLGNKDIKHMKSARPTALLGRTGNQERRAVFWAGQGVGRLVMGSSVFTSQKYAVLTSKLHFQKLTLKK